MYSSGSTSCRATRRARCAARGGSRAWRAGREYGRETGSSASTTTSCVLIIASDGPHEGYKTRTWHFISLLDQVIRENPVSRGTESLLTSAAFLTSRTGRPLRTDKAGCKRGVALQRTHSGRPNNNKRAHVKKSARASSAPPSSRMAAAGPVNNTERRTWARGLIPGGGAGTHSSTTPYSFLDLCAHRLRVDVLDAVPGQG